MPKDGHIKTIRASRFVLSTLKLMERISIDTIGNNNPLTSDMGIKYIIVPSLAHTFTRYVVFTAPLELVTDFGSQFVIDLLSHFHQETGIKHHTTIPYSKEENGIVERVDKEVNRHIRNIFFDLGPVKTGHDYCV